MLQAIVWAMPVSWARVGSLPTVLLGYVDVGTGSYLLQLLLAGLFGLAYTVRLHWARVRASLRRMTGRKADDDGPASGAADSGVVS
jgi:hypothetical protein